MLHRQFFAILYCCVLPWLHQIVVVCRSADNSPFYIVLAVRETFLVEGFYIYICLCVSTLWRSTVCTESHILKNFLLLKGHEIQVAYVSNLAKNTF